MQFSTIFAVLALSAGALAAPSAILPRAEKGGEAGYTHCENPDGMGVSKEVLQAQRERVCSETNWTEVPAWTEDIHDKGHTRAKFPDTVWDAEGKPKILERKQHRPAQS
jgi:hypothetical protein